MHEKSEPIQQLGKLVAANRGLDLTNPEDRAAYVAAVKELSYCRDTMALVQYLQEKKPGTYGKIRNSFSGERDD